MSADDPVDCFDVAVVGLGPVGELAAILLARSDLRVLAVDREADVYGNPAWEFSMAKRCEVCRRRASTSRRWAT